ncbi:putative competence/damage-inducible protein CinA [Coniochaeta sp. 2T2.1]|nr:putative competence/damage-inducible protein CinA [Coniochaeta sp. 2T2.1]
MAIQTPYTPEQAGTTLSLATEIISLLHATNSTLGVAESLTGGLLAAALTSVPGASAVFRGGVVSYATELKEHLLHVDSALIKREGVIHPDVAKQMAEGARRITGLGQETETTWGVGTTGVAGPEKQDGKDVGTVYIGIAGPEGTRAWGPYRLKGGRERVREATVLEALVRLRGVLLAKTGEGEVGG